MLDKCAQQTMHTYGLDKEQDFVQAEFHSHHQGNSNLVQMDCHWLWETYCLQSLHMDTDGPEFRSWHKHGQVCLK